MKPPRFNAPVVAVDFNAGDRRRTAPQIGFRPFGGRACWFEKQNVGVDATLAMGHEQRQFAHTGP